ncbi:MAG: hypothetical protein ACWA5W_06055 [Phycisphaerales bacterium]
MRLLNRNIANLSLSVLFLAGGVVPLCASAQASAAAVQPDSEHDRELELLRDFIHFVKIARFDVAADLGNQLIDLGMDPEAFVDMVEGSREQLLGAAAAGAAIGVGSALAARARKKKAIQAEGA